MTIPSFRSLRTALTAAALPLLLLPATTSAQAPELVFLSGITATSRGGDPSHHRRGPDRCRAGRSRRAARRARARLRGRRRHERLPQGHPPLRGDERDLPRILRERSPHARHRPGRPPRPGRAHSDFGGRDAGPRPRSSRLRVCSHPRSPIRGASAPATCSSSREPRAAIPRPTSPSRGMCRPRPGASSATSAWSSKRPGWATATWSACKVFLDDVRLWGDMNVAYGEFVTAGDPPARAAVRGGLMNPGLPGRDPVRGGAFGRPAGGAARGTAARSLTPLAGDCDG